MQENKDPDSPYFTSLFGNTHIKFVIDSGSFKNFISESIVDELNLPVQQNIPYHVYFGNSESEIYDKHIILDIPISSKKYIKQIKLYVSKHYL